jgi:RING finger protein 121/175
MDAAGVPLPGARMGAAGKGAAARALQQVARNASRVLANSSSQAGAALAAAATRGGGNASAAGGAAGAGGEVLVLEVVEEVGDDELLVDESPWFAVLMLYFLLVEFSRRAPPPPRQRLRGALFAPTPTPPTPAWLVETTNLLNRSLPPPPTQPPPPPPPNQKQFLMIGAQAALVVWRQRHRASYERVTFAALWVVPAGCALGLGFWRFVGVWTLYSLATAAVLYAPVTAAYGPRVAALAARLTGTGAAGGAAPGRAFTRRARALVDHNTPRRVYSWFLAVFAVSRAMGVAGYVMVLLEVFGAGPLLSLFLPAGASLTLLFYGLYFGILTRDCAELAAESMALLLGAGGGMGRSGGSGGGGGGGAANGGGGGNGNGAGAGGGLASAGPRLGLTANACGICSGEMLDYSHLGEALPEGVEPCVQLRACKHSFHLLCVKGWAVVGKKDLCPVCNEKVELRSLLGDNPWETSNVQWLQQMDMFRYLVAYLPLVLLAFSAFVHLFPDHAHRHMGVKHPFRQTTATVVGVVEVGGGGVGVGGGVDLGGGAAGALGGAAGGGGGGALAAAGGVSAR